MPVISPYQVPSQAVPSVRTDAVPAQAVASVSLPIAIRSAFEKGCLPLNKAKVTDVVPPFWIGVALGKVTLFNGETGAGKSSFFRLFCLHATLNLPLWGLEFGLGREARILYIDPENMGDASSGDGGLTVARMDMLGLGRPTTVILHSGMVGDGEMLNLANARHMAELTEYITENQIDIVILDPYAVLFQVSNENDNAEAMRNIAALKMLARNTECAVILCHHTGKLGEDSKANVKYGRGASALLAGADIGITFCVKSANSDQLGIGDDVQQETETKTRLDYVRLKVEKNRVGFDYDTLYLKMAGEGEFVRVSQKEFQSGTIASNRVAKRAVQEEEARQSILAHLECAAQFSWAEIQIIAKEKRIAEAPFKSVLDQLVKNGDIASKRGGHGKVIYGKPT